MKVKAAVPHTTLAVPIDRSNSGPTSHSASSKSTEPHLIMPKSAVGAVTISGAQLSSDHVRAAVSLHVKPAAPLDLAASVVVRFGAKARSPSRQGSGQKPRTMKGSRKPPSTKSSPPSGGPSAQPRPSQPLAIPSTAPLRVGKASLRSAKMQVMTSAAPAPCSSRSAVKTRTSRGPPQRSGASLRAHGGSGVK